MIALRDPSGLSEAVLTVSQPALLILAMLDGEHSILDIQTAMSRRTGQLVLSDDIQKLLDKLGEALFLEGDAFETYYEELSNDYRRSTVRQCRDPRTYGANVDDAAAVERLVGDIIAKGGQPEKDDNVVGLIAPHLDYGRGAVCYADAYRSLAKNCGARRFVLLGTNHFGRSTSVVATDKAFETPLGATPVDSAFLSKLEEKCGRNLRDGEFDHLREHSVELQVVFLQHLFGAENISIVPFLCPDPCGPTGTAPYDGQGVDLRDFALALGVLIAEVEDETCVIAGADLSHVGGSFGDSRELTDGFLQEVEESDHQALDCLERGDPAAMVQVLKSRENATRICSAGCIYAAMSALPRARPRLLRYHQAVDRESQTCVTAAALVLTQDNNGQSD
jgi:hypothetical protein